VDRSQLSLYLSLAEFWGGVVLKQRICLNFLET
jgi:hypothetical protein